MEEQEDMKLAELTSYQLRFIDEYMKCGNKREAMLECGYKGKGKRSSVTSSAAKLYNLPKVKEEIERQRVKTWTHIKYHLYHHILLKSFG